jgi:hypothetical protein
MYTTTRLLLPFTEGINAQAIDYAIQLAEKRQATLVPLALIPVRPDQKTRPESLQQAQDFLELARHKAARQGVPVELARVSTGDAALSIEAMAGEMGCEAVLLFLCNTNEVLLGHAQIRALMDRSTCNMCIILFPEKRRRFANKHLLHLSLLRRVEDDSLRTQIESLLEEPSCEQARLVRYPGQANSLN